MPSSPVVPAPSAGLRLPRDPGSVRQARGLVRDRLDDWGLSDLIDDASLVVTELATNAVVHAHSSYVVSAVRLGRAVRIEVRDEGHGRTPVRAGTWSDAALGGRGLMLVDALSSAWGVRDEVAGKTVWAELSA